MRFGEGRLLEDGEGVLGTFKRWWMVSVAWCCWRTERAHLNAFWRDGEWVIDAMGLEVGTVKFF
jgi:hypothetical protein